MSPWGKTGPAGHQPSISMCRGQEAFMKIYEKKAFMKKIILMIPSWLEPMLTERLCRKSTSKKKIQIKGWYMILGIYRDIE